MESTEGRGRLRARVAVKNKIDLTNPHWALAVFLAGDGDTETKLRLLLEEWCKEICAQTITIK